MMGRQAKAVVHGGVTLALYAAALIAIPSAADSDGLFCPMADGLTARVAAGTDESPSSGSYSVRIFDGTEFAAGVLAERDGEIAQAWIIPDGGAWLVVVWIRSAGSGADGRLDAWRFDGRGLRGYQLPTPPTETLEGYLGHDLYRMENGVLIREFPVYLPGDCNAAPSGGVRRLALRPPDGQWSIMP